MNQGTTDVDTPLSGHPGSGVIDLQQFCSTEQFRLSLHEPFSHGEFTYASDGIVAVRVARRQEFEEAKDPKLPRELDKWLAPLVTSAFKSSWIIFPTDQETETREQCDSCEGRGKDHDCPDCDCTCDDCGGRGTQSAVERISVDAFGRIFRLKYLQQICQLPGIEIDPSGEGTRPMLFRFDGGVGVLMPCSRKLDKHIDL